VLWKVYVGLRHRDHGKGPPLSFDGIGGVGVLFLLGQKSEASYTIFLRGSNLMPCQFMNIYDMRMRGTDLARHCGLGGCIVVGVTI
jgi:hypothetical protein